jgi:hypothetical protein
MIRHILLASATVALLSGVAACDRPDEPNYNSPDTPYVPRRSDPVVPPQQPMTPAPRELPQAPPVPAPQDPPDASAP